MSDIEDTAREAPALIRYLDEGAFVTRRYVSQGAEMNTGNYRDYPVVVRDGMLLRRHFQLDTHGFVIDKHETAVADFHDKAAVDAGYQREVEALVARRLGQGAGQGAGQGRCGVRWLRFRQDADAVHQKAPS